jgi:hypothetical protein
MHRYLVTYDLVGTSETSEDYRRLIARIESYPDWGKVQKSVYLVKSEATSPKAVADDLWRYMDGNDRIFVVEVASNYSWANVLCQESWLEQFFST